jgi:hypothetical protein
MKAISMWTATVTHRWSYAIEAVGCFKPHFATAAEYRRSTRGVMLDVGAFEFSSWGPRSTMLGVRRRP